MSSLINWLLSWISVSDVSTIVDKSPDTDSGSVCKVSTLAHDDVRDNSSYTSFITDEKEVRRKLNKKKRQKYVKCKRWV